MKLNQGNTRNNGEIMIPMRRGFDSSTCIFDENVLVPAPLFTAQTCIVITSDPVKLFDFLIHSKQPDYLRLGTKKVQGNF